MVLAMIWGLVTVAVLVVVAVIFVFASKLRQKEEAPNALLLLQNQIEALRELLRQTLDSNTARISEQLKSQLELWTKTHDTVGNRLDNAAKVVGQLETRMVKVEEVAKQVLEVGKDIASLQQILKAPKLRGNIGEYFLADLLSQMMPREHFDLQYTFANGERVDAVIKTAGGLIPVDSKFPLENFQRLVEARSDDERKQLRKAFLSDVKKHVDDISQKYIQPTEGTLELALMYVPAENVYYEIITRGDFFGEEFALASFAWKKHVLPVSPNSLYGYLQTILYGLRGLQVESRTKEILDELIRLRLFLEKFHDEFAKLGKHLSYAQGSYQEAEKKLTRFEEKMASLEAPVPSEALPAPEQELGASP